MLGTSALGPQIGLRAGFWPDCFRESIKIGPPAGRRAGRRADFVFVPVAVRPKSSPEADIRLGSNIVYHRIGLGHFRSSSGSEGGTSFCFSVIDVKIGFNLIDLRIPLAPAGHIDLPACGALRAPQARRGRRGRRDPQSRRD